MSRLEQQLPGPGRGPTQQKEPRETIRVPETRGKAFRAFTESVLWDEFLKRDHDTILAFEKEIDTDKEMSAMFDKEGNEWIRLDHYRSLADDIIARSAYEKDTYVSLTAENFISLLQKYEISFDKDLLRAYQELKG